jgi:hypothetical protein
MPKTHVSRSIEIASSPEEVFAYLEDFKKWPQWSPWLILEPDCTLDFSDDGSTYTWEGNLIGSGEIERSTLHSPVSMTCELRTAKPWKSNSTVGFSVKKSENGSLVSWTMDGSVPLPLFWMKPMIQGLVGMDYVRGLHMLKDLCETGKVPSSMRTIDN